MVSPPNLKKRFGNSHYEFLASYTWSHAIDDSTDLQSPLAPQDSYFPPATNVRHHCLISATGWCSAACTSRAKLTGSVAFSLSRFFSNWTVAPILEVASGRPFNIITGNPDNFQFSPSTSRPNQCSPGRGHRSATPCGLRLWRQSSHRLDFFRSPATSSLLSAARSKSRCQSARRQYLSRNFGEEAVDRVQRPANFPAT